MGTDLIFLICTSFANEKNGVCPLFRAGRSYVTIELVGAAVLIGALVANNLFLRWQAAPR